MWQALTLFLWPQTPRGTFFACVLPFCTQSIKSELQLAHRQELQAGISDKPTYPIQDKHVSSLKSVLSIRAWWERLGVRRTLGRDAKYFYAE